MFDLALKIDTALRFLQVKLFQLRCSMLGLPDARADSPIVSLASYGKRLETVHLAIGSILDQTLPPAKVVLYVDVESNTSLASPWLSSLPADRFELREVPNLCSNNKWFYVMQEFAGIPVVTIDDDVLYDRDTIESLVRTGKLYPGHVVGRRVYRITFCDDGALNPYGLWEPVNSAGSYGRGLFATGVGGVLYPPNCLHDGAFDEVTLRRICLRQDDIWLKASTLCAGFSVVRAPSSRPHPLTIPGSQTNALYQTNVATGLNDECMLAAMDYFGLTPEDFR